MVATLSTAQLQQYLNAMAQWRQLRGDSILEVATTTSVPSTESPEAVESASAANSAVMVQSVRGFFQAAHWQPESKSTEVSASQPSLTEAENTPAWSFDDEPETVSEPEASQAQGSIHSTPQPPTAPIVGTVGSFFASTQWIPREVDPGDEELVNAPLVRGTLPVNLSKHNSSPHLVGTVQHFFAEAHWH